MTSYVHNYSNFTILLLCNDILIHIKNVTNSQGILLKSGRNFFTNVCEKVSDDIFQKV